MVDTAQELNGVDMTELKACPFCESSDVGMKIIPADDSCFIGCNTCNSRGSSAESWFSTQGGLAIAAWNNAKRPAKSISIDELISEFCDSDPAFYDDFMAAKEKFNSIKSQKTDGESSDGSTANYYQLPPNATELQHLISYRNMNAQDGEIFRAIYRKGRASHSDQLRDAKKVLFYAKAEVERLEKFGASDMQARCLAQSAKVLANCEDAE